MDKDAISKDRTTLHFITKDESFLFFVNIENDARRCDFVKQMLLIFFGEFKQENKKINVLRYSKELKHNVEKFICDNKEHPELFKIKQKLKEGEYFFVYPLSLNLGQIEQLKLMDQIAKLNNVECPCLERQYSKILKYYKVYFFQEMKSKRLERVIGKEESVVFVEKPNLLDFQKYCGLSADAQPR